MKLDVFHIDKSGSRFVSHSVAISDGSHGVGSIKIDGSAAASSQNRVMGKNRVNPAAFVV